jgi:hypothetical protein
MGLANFVVEAMTGCSSAVWQGEAGVAVCVTIGA